MKMTQKERMKTGLIYDCTDPKISAEQNACIGAVCPAASGIVIRAAAETQKNNGKKRRLKKKSFSRRCFFVLVGFQPCVCLLAYLPDYLSAVLRPAHCSGLRLGNDDRLKELDRLLKSLVYRHQAVLMLDRKNSVIADKSEVRNKISPILLRVAVADGAEYP